MAKKILTPERIQMERDLLRYDRQKLVTLNLKLYDACENFQFSIRELTSRVEVVSHEAQVLTVELERVKALPRWKLLLKRFK